MTWINAWTQQKNAKTIKTCKSNIILIHITFKHTKTKHIRSLDARLMVCLMKHVKTANENAMNISNMQDECKGMMHIHSTSMYTHKRPYKGTKC